MLSLHFELHKMLDNLHLYRIVLILYAYEQTNYTLSKS